MAIDSLPMLGPHEGRELELLLSGEKPIAFFYEGLPDEFLPYLESGILKSRTKTTTTRLPNIQIENILIYKDVAIELERRTGQLLGYREEDIEFYLQHLSRNNK